MNESMYLKVDDCQKRNRCNVVDELTFFIKVFVFGMISIQPIGLLTGQEADFFVGINANRFYDFQKNEGHFKSTYSPGIGYQIGLTISNIQIAGRSHQFRLVLEQVAGDLDNRSGGLGGSYVTDASIRKNWVSIEMYPLNVHVLKNMEAAIGFHLKVLAGEKRKGYQSVWIMGGQSSNIDLQHSKDPLSTFLSAGFGTLFTYQLPLTNTQFLIFSYHFYLGLSNEFKNLSAETKSMQSSIEVGMGKTLNSRR